MARHLRTKSSWRHSDEGLLIDAVVPPNSTATAILPTGRIEHIRVNGKPLAEGDGAKVNAAEGAGTVSVKLVPGTHQLLISEDTTTAQAETIAPPSGGRGVLTFGPQHAIDFQFQNVKANAGWTEVSKMPFQHAYRIEADQRFSDPENMHLRVPITQRVRKGDLSIEVVNAQGRPVPGAQVSINMRKHAFGFGNAVSSEVLGASKSDFPIRPKRNIVVTWDEAQQYRQVVQKYFDPVTFESELRPRHSVIPTSNRSFNGVSGKKCIGNHPPLSGVKTGRLSQPAKCSSIWSLESGGLTKN